MTLKDLEKMNGLVSLSKLAKLFGYEYTRFHTRIKRGGPELTPDESRKILALLNKHGLQPTPPARSPGLTGDANERDENMPSR